MSSVSKSFVKVSVAILSIVGYGIFVFAAAPTGGYVPGQTNDPACAPGDTDCLVQTGWNIDAQNSFLYTTTHKVGIGTNTPLTDFMVDGDVLLGTATSEFLLLSDAAALGFAVPPNTPVVGVSSSAGVTDGFYNIYLGVPNGQYSLGIQNNEYSYNLGLSGTNDGFEFSGVNNDPLVDQSSNVNIRPDIIQISASNNFAGINSYSEFSANGNISLNANGVNNGSVLYANPDSVGIAFHTESTQNDGNGTPLVIQVGDENTRGGGFSARSRNLTYANAGADMFVWDQALGGDRTWIWMDETKIDSGLKLDQYFAGVTNYTANNVSEMSFDFHNGNPDTTMNSKYSITSDFTWSKPASLGNIMTLSGITGQLSLPSASFNLGGYNVVFPGSYGSTGDVLVTDGAGNLSWTTVASSPISVQNSTSLISTGLSGTGSGGAFANNIIFGTDAGQSASSASYSIFLGTAAGQNATWATGSNFIGYGAGLGANNAGNANFLGQDAGRDAVNATYANFLGQNAGRGASGAASANMIGYVAGYMATNAAYANFLGQSAGYMATNAVNSIFIGLSAGNGSTNASNAIFLGQNAGSADTVNNTGNTSNFSILIGPNTSTGGYSNSIAMGQSAINTAANQFMIGSVAMPIDTMRINGAASTQCTITTGTGIACTSDERVKTNIADMSSSILDQVTQIRTVTYNWLGDPNGKRQIGFLAQDLERYFPELVETDKEGMKSVYYAQMTPVLVESIRELDIKLDNLESIALLTNQSFIDRLISWLGDTANGLTKIHVDQEVCINTTCINEQDLQQFKQWQSSQGGVPQYSGESSSGGSPDSNSDSELAPDSDMGTSETGTVDMETVETDVIPQSTDPAPDATETDTNTNSESVIDSSGE